MTQVFSSQINYKNSGFVSIAAASLQKHAFLNKNQKFEEGGIPKGPSRTKNTTGSECTTCSEFTIDRDHPWADANFLDFTGILPP